MGSWRILRAIAWRWCGGREGEEGVQSLEQKHRGWDWVLWGRPWGRGVGWNCYGQACVTSSRGERYPYLHICYPTKNNNRT